MAPWKVLLIGLLALSSLALAMATIAVPLAQEGARRWAWLAGLLLSTIVMGTLLSLFLRHAGAALTLKPRGGRR